MFDVLISGGRVADGTGNPLRRVDVALEGDRIVEVGSLFGAVAGRHIDATGKIVCPGFVDPHSHSDRSVHANPTADSTIRQGVTSEIVGNCGASLAPVSNLSVGDVQATLRNFGSDDLVTWRSFGEYLELLRARGTSQNLGWLVGHNAIRAAAGVTGEVVSDEELAVMEGYVAEAMESGALGMSSGLEFHPGRQASTEELVRLNKVVGRYHGIYASHVRNRDTDLQESVDEFLRIVREGGTRGEFSHLNVRYNTGAAPGAWRRAVDTIARAREDGLEVLIDTTPYLDGPGRMSGILPPWIVEHGPAEAARLLGDPDIRRRLRGECDRYWRFIHKGEWDRVAPLGIGVEPQFAGRSFADISAQTGEDEWDVFFDILHHAGENMETIQMVGRLFTEEHSAEMVSHPLFSLAVDIYSSSVTDPLRRITRHPMSFAGTIHYLTHHVRERGTLRLEEAIRKMTSMPAAHFALPKRGLLTPGWAADVVVFDFDRLDDVATVENPAAYVRGVEYVFVNGTAVIDNEEHTGARPGQFLRSA